MAETEEKAKERARRNKKYSYVLMALFTLLMVGGIVMLIFGIKMDTTATTIDAVLAMAGKIALCVLGSILALSGFLLLISAIVMANTKFEGRSRNPINNFFKDTVSEFQDMMDETGETLVPGRKRVKVCPECGQENGANETICTRCGGGLGD